MAGTAAGATAYSVEECLAALRAVPERPVTAAAYERARQPHQPSSRALVKRFGSWARALDAAGLVPVKSDGWTAAECVGAIKTARRAIGHAPTADEYRTWRRTAGLWLPSSNTIIRRVGWSRALAEATGTVRPARGRWATPGSSA